MAIEHGVSPAMGGRRRIAFISSSFPGHFYPTLELARALIEKGLPVVYLLTGGGMRIKAELDREGLEYEDISGLLEFNQLNALMRKGALRSARLLLRRQIGELRKVLDARDIALVLVDNFIRYTAILSTFSDIPAATLCFNYTENIRVSDPISRRDMLREEAREGARLMPLLRHWAKNPGFMLDRLFGVQREIERFAALRRIKTDCFIYSRTRIFAYPAIYAAPRELLPEEEARGVYLGLCVTPRAQASAAEFEARAKG